MCVDKRAAAAPARPLFVHLYISHRPFRYPSVFFFFFLPDSAGRREARPHLPGEAPSLKQTAVSPLHVSRHFMSPFYDWAPSAGEGGEKKSIAGINVAWTHRRVGYYTCKKLLEAAPASSLVLCTWWSRYEGRRRQLHACNEYPYIHISIYLYIQYICIIYIKILII